MSSKEPYIRLPYRTVVFVGDGCKALVLLNVGNGLRPRLTVQKAFEDNNPSTHEQGSDKPGRTLSGTEPNRSAMEQTDWHGIQKHKFACTVAGALDLLLRELQTKRLIIIAPPRTLADLRRSFSPAVEKSIVAELAKDLTGLSVSDISQYLAARS